MRIVYVSAGAGGMYCGSCLNDNALAAALLAQGHEVTLVPTYTPMRSDGVDVSVDRIFFGAVGVYLTSRLPWLGRAPRLLQRVVGGRWLLARLGDGSASVDAALLGRLTHSVLRGEDGPQRGELRRLVQWVVDLRPEVVHLTNSLFLGLAGPMRRALGVPVVCSLQGEEIFIDGLESPWRERVEESLRRRAQDVDAFVAPGTDYATRMAARLGIARERVHVVPLGIPLAGFAPSATPPASRPFVVGYLARICPEKGLHLLAAAFRRLAQRRGADQVRLRIAGYLSARDRAYLDGVLKQLADWGLGAAVDTVGEVDRDQKIRFLQSLHVLSVPSPYADPKGRYVLEALACGVPVVQPHHGAFPELIAATGGGLLFEPGSESALAAALDDLADDDAERVRLGRAGQQNVIERHSDQQMAHATLQLYARLIGRTEASHAHLSHAATD